MKYLIYFLIIGFLLVTVRPVIFAQKMPEAPKTLEEARTIGERILFVFPEVLKKIWQEALGIFRQIFNWFKNIWDSYIYPWLRGLLIKEVEKRKPEVQKKFEEEKKEMKQEIPVVAKSLWQRFIELIK